ncbi:gasdermin-E [Trichomycterus rosablanca]|uniref:gasdermin-E n=1 Tax=Trichomycterus rosablanca TaxID=2290929 RepID=UPI002F351547
MFEETTRRLLREVDRDGSLIAVSRLNDSKKLEPLAVVIKRSPSRFWQKTKYRPTDFTLNDLLQGKPIQTDAVLKNDMFAKYIEKTESVVFGSGEAGMTGVSIGAKGSKTYKLLSSLGTLNKESLKIPHFLKQSKNRRLDPQHCLIQQTRGRSNQTFTVVKERILTTSDCIIENSRMGEGGCSAVLTALRFSPAKVYLKENIFLHSDTDVALELPPRTVMAYSVSELTIKSDGRFELCVQPDGLETDKATTLPAFHAVSEVDGLGTLHELQKGSSLSALKSELADTKAHLAVLAHQAPQTCFMLLSLFQQNLSNRTFISTLEDKLDGLCSGEAPYTDLPDTSDKLLDMFVKILLSAKYIADKLPTIPLHSAYSSHNGSEVKSTQQNLSVLTAMHMLVSATDVLTDDGVDSLKSLLSEDTISGLNYLVTRLTNNSQHVLLDDLPLKLRNGDIFQSVKQLFSTSGVVLKTDNRELWAETESTHSTLPLVLCTVIHGLAYLREGCKVDKEI